MSEVFDDVQTDILRQINERGIRDKFQTFDGAVPTGKELKEEHGRYWPYVVVGFGGKSEAAGRQRGITSSAEDVKWTSLVVFCVGESAATVRKLKSILRKMFEGYAPMPGWGQYTEVLSGDFGISKPDPDLSPLRFGETIAFKSLTDV